MINFIVLKNNKNLPPNISSKKILQVLPYIKCGWCYTCMEKFFIYGTYFEDHYNHNLLNVHIYQNDYITKLCWITQKYSNLIYDIEWKNNLKKNNLTPV